MSTHGNEHWTIVNIVFRYLRGTTYFKICYQGKLKTHRKVEVHGFVDSDLASDSNRIQLANKYVFKLFGGAVSWISRRQLVVAPLDTEAKYMVATHASKEVVWLK